VDRARRLLPALWLGVLLCVALLATPAPFATLEQADAGRVVARMLAQEAYTSLALGVLLLVLERLRARSAAEAGQGSQFRPA
jgi:peptidoglycan/LPS O-acetylase OafA/YrhL